METKAQTVGQGNKTYPSSMDRRWQKQDMNPRLTDFQSCVFPCPCSGSISMFQVEGATFRTEEIDLGFSTIRIGVTSVALAIYSNIINRHN